MSVPTKKKKKTVVERETERERERTRTRKPYFTRIGERQRQADREKKRRLELLFFLNQNTIKKKYIKI